MLPSVTATRYVTPLREGGSLPGLMECDDLGTYVVKFVGAGQGRKALVAEVVCARLARILGLPVPELVTVEVDPRLAVGEPDQEVQQLLRASEGRNLGMDYLPGSLDVDPSGAGIDAVLAGRVLWFDALVGNVDRSWRNPNMLWWHRALVLIDHGACLTFAHSWPAAAAFPLRAYDARDHAVLCCEPDLLAADAALAPLATGDAVATALEDVPEEWLEDEPGFGGASEVRAAYADLLAARIEARASWLAGVLATVREATAGAQVRTNRGGRRPAWLADVLPGGPASTTDRP